jgi:hypothetical protein
MSDEVAVLDAFVGEWDVEVTVRPGPDVPPVNQTGDSHSRLLGGKWLVMDYRTRSGFEGHGVYGWDPQQQRYTGAWVDNMMVSIARSEGTWDAATRTLDLATAATVEGRTIRYRETRQILGDGSHLYRNLMPMPDGTELEVVRAVYRRR